MEALRKEFLRLLEEDVEFRYAVAGRLGILEILEKFDAMIEEQTKIWREIEGIRREQVRIWEEIRMLREDFRRMDVRLGRVERTLEKLTVDVEDEARSIIRYRVREELGVDLELESLILPDIEINIYGVSDDLCVVGEASVRAGVNLLYELLEKIDLLRRKYPERLRKRILPVIYVCIPLPELVEEAKKRRVWILKATKDYYKPKLI